MIQLRLELTTFLIVIGKSIILCIFKRKSTLCIFRGKSTYVCIFRGNSVKERGLNIFT